jgi:hypothetical protein
MLLDQHQTANPICEVDGTVDRMELFVGLRLRCPVTPAIEGADAKNRGKLIPKDEQSVILGLETREKLSQNPWRSNKLPSECAEKGCETSQRMTTIIESCAATSLTMR